MILNRLASIVVGSVVLLCGAQAEPGLPGAAGALVNARIHTLETGQPVAEALAWDSTGRIIAIGRREAVLAKAAGATVHDANGATVVPGFIDAHAHLTGLGYALMQADLVGARSMAEVLERLTAFAANLPDGAWLLGRGWDQNLWPGKAFPTAADLDAAFPTRPVWLERVDGHAGWANSVAMRRVSRDLMGDWQPDGGRIVRASGKPTGVFVDAAAALVDAVVPKPDDALRAEALRRALAAAASVGLTGVHDMGTSPAKALRGFTLDAAWAAFMDNEVGRLAPGLRADFVLLDADPLTAPARQLPQIKVLSTWVDGVAVYRAAP